MRAGPTAQHDLAACHGAVVEVQVLPSVGGGHCIVKLDVQPPQHQLHEAFSWSEARNVTKTATVSLHGSSW